MTVSSRFLSMPTKSYAWVSLVLMVIGWGLDAITGPLWVRFGIHGQALEYLGGGVSWLGFALLLLLVPIAAFRPDNRFYLHGDCKLRAKRVGFVLGVLLAVWVVIIVGIAAMMSGLGFGV